MVMSRGIKQVLYGAGFLLFFSGVMFGVYSLVFKAAPTCFDVRQNGAETGIDCGGGCAPCAQKYAQDIQVGAVGKFAANGKLVVVAALENPNDVYGFSDVVYTMKALDEQGELLGSASAHTFIYDKNTKGNRYIIDTLAVATGTVAEITVEFSDAEAVSSEEFIEPKITIKRSSTDIVGLKKVTEPVYVFKRNLIMKATGDDVKKLEEFLAQKQFFKKLPDITFDLDTKLALTAYQKAKKISPVSGIFDTKTRTTVNAEVDRITRFVVEPVHSAAVAGVVKNDDLVAAAKVIVTALLYDATGVQIGGSKTELDGLDAATERNFKILFAKETPIDKVDSARTRVFVDAIR